MLFNPRSDLKTTRYPFINGLYKSMELNETVLLITVPLPISRKATKCFLFGNALELTKCLNRHQII